MKAPIVYAAVVALLAVSTAYCRCTDPPSACSTRTPAEFMEQYDSHIGTGPVNLAVKITDLILAENSPLTFTDFPFILNRTNECNTGVCNEACGFRAPNIFLDFFQQYGRANCPWNYVCDYDPQRIPQYLYHAECITGLTRAKVVEYPIPVLKTVEPSCDPLDNTTTTWKWEVQRIPVACICQRVL